MTNYEALSASVNYPVDKIKVQKILIDNGLNETDSYSGLNKEFELAMASMYVLLVTSANITEGDFQVSATDKSNYLILASGIYSKYGVDNPLEKKPKIVNRSKYN
jgi:hypothetical protein